MTMVCAVIHLHHAIHSLALVRAGGSEPEIVVRALPTLPTFALPLPPPPPAVDDLLTSSCSSTAHRCI